MKIIDIKQGSPEWKKLRYSKIGCSDLADIMGCGFGSPYKKYCEKIYEIEIPDNEDMKRGRDNEAIALAAFNYEYASDRDLLPCVAISDEHEWLMCSFDGWDGQTSVEIKCPRKCHHKEIPLYYIPQLQGSMAVSNAEIAHFWSWYNGTGELFSVKRDQQYIDEMLLRAKEFYDRVISFNPPPKQLRDCISTEDFEKNGTNYI